MVVGWSVRLVIRGLGSVEVIKGARLVLVAKRFRVVSTNQKHPENDIHG